MLSHTRLGVVLFVVPMLYRILISARNPMACPIYVSRRRSTRAGWCSSSPSSRPRRSGMARAPASSTRTRRLRLSASISTMTSTLFLTHVTSSHPPTPFTQCRIVWSAHHAARCDVLICVLSALLRLNWGFRYADDELFFQQGPATSTSLFSLRFFQRCATPHAPLLSAHVDRALTGAGGCLQSDVVPGVQARAPIPW